MIEKDRLKLVNIGACSAAIDWADQYDTLQEAWDNCTRLDWMLWLFVHTKRSCEEFIDIATQIYRLTDKEIENLQLGTTTYLGYRYGNNAIYYALFDIVSRKRDPCIHDIVLIDCQYTKSNICPVEFRKILPKVPL